MSVSLNANLHPLKPFTLSRVCRCSHILNTSEGPTAVVDPVVLCQIIWLSLWWHWTVSYVGQQFSQDLGNNYQPNVLSSPKLIQHHSPSVAYLQCCIIALGESAHLAGEKKGILGRKQFCVRNAPDSSHYFSIFKQKEHRGVECSSSKGKIKGLSDY